MAGAPVVPKTPISSPIQAASASPSVKRAQAKSVAKLETETEIPFSMLSEGPTPQFKSAVASKTKETQPEKKPVLMIPHP